MAAVPQTLAAPRKPGRDRYLYGLAIAAALLLSLAVHGTLAFSLLKAGGRDAGGGEGGVRGGGDVTVDISVAGPLAPVITPAQQSSSPTPLAPPLAPQPVVAPPTPPAPPPEVTPAAVPHPPHPRDTPPVETADEDPTPVEPAVTPPSPPDSSNSAASTANGRQTDLDLPATGTDADVTSGGRAPGLPDDALRSLLMGLAGDAPDTVAGQRALLPAAMTCDDPVAGTWRAFKYNPITSDWVRFTLVIHHAPGGALTGTITSRIWFGGPFTRSPPECQAGLPDYTVRMPAHGRVDEHNRITFGSSSYSVIAVHCPVDDYDYAPDNFSGTIDSMRQEFQSVNNDGAWDINSPYLFRRTGCVDE